MDEEFKISKNEKGETEVIFDFDDEHEIAFTLED